MPTGTLSVRYQDAHGKVGTFGVLVDTAYDDGVYAEIIALVQSMLDASQAQVTGVQLLKDLDIVGSLTGNSAVTGGAYDRIDDQAILAWRSPEGLDIRMSVPAPVDGLFATSGAYAQQDVDPASTELLAVIAAGSTTPVLAPKVGTTPLSFRKGWRKGQKHS